MPPVFKALATVVAWILFVFGCLALLAGFGRILGIMMNLVSVPSVHLMASYFGIGIVSLILSVVAMRLRQMLE
jgi:hypothetical protein